MSATCMINFSKHTGIHPDIDKALVYGYAVQKHNEAKERVLSTIKIDPRFEERVRAAIQRRVILLEDGMGLGALLMDGQIGPDNLDNMITAEIHGLVRAMKRDERRQKKNTSVPGESAEANSNQNEEK